MRADYGSYFVTMYMTTRLYNEKKRRESEKKRKKKRNQERNER